MYEIASDVDKILSASLSGISIENSSSNAITTSTVSRLSSPRSFWKAAEGFTYSTIWIAAHSHQSDPQAMPAARGGIFSRWTVSTPRSDDGLVLSKVFSLLARRSEYDRKQTDLRLVHFVKVFDDVQYPLCDLVLIQEGTFCEAPPERHRKRCAGLSRKTVLDR